MQPAAGYGPQEWTADFTFVQEDEHRRINAWRVHNDRLPVLPATAGTDRIYDTAGLALSGGGIRSAAFCLGVLQALDTAKRIKTIDYLSTVSGGGYIGASFTAGMNRTSGKFPFSTGPLDKHDNQAVGHVRDFSNYLMAGGITGLIESAAVILRGLAVNLAIVTAVILLFAGITCLFNPNQDAALKPDIFGFEKFKFHEVVDTLGPLAFSKIAVFVGVLIFIAWGFARSLQRADAEAQTEFRPVPFSWRNPWRRLAFWWLCLTALITFFEIQPFAMRAVFYQNYALEPPTPTDPLLFAARAAAAKSSAAEASGLPGVLGWFIGPLATYASYLSQYLAPISAVIALFSKYFGDIIKTKSGDTAIRARAMRLVSQAMLLLAALALPLIIWVIYLHVAIWGDIGFQFRPGWLRHAVTLVCGDTDFGTLAGDHKAALLQALTEPDRIVPPLKTTFACAAPEAKYLIPVMYIATGLAFLLPAILWLKPNANSLHRLYRDRLSKAFLFDPTLARKMTLDATGPNGASAVSASADERSDLPALDTLKFQQLHSANGPVHLMNCALNIEASAFANQRGRKADFFFFSPAWSGSKATGFTKTRALAAAEPGLDVATAMAASAAAASSNMGRQSIFGLAPTLALLNIRLGYWMKNPNRRYWSESALPKLLNFSPLKQVANFYLLKEMFSRLDEKAPQVYLTDGGHIENLGLYELLRRRCKTIIVVDAEADPGYNFPSLIDAQRYARIDLGVRIDLPWQTIRDQALELDALFATDKTAGTGKRKDCAHAAIGKIDYGAEEKGVIMYIKASITGDENDNVLSYKARNPSFPHETTSDQFFSEEQFEVYRALGNHALRKALSGEAHVAGVENLPKFEPPVSERQDDFIAARKAAFKRFLA